MQYSLPVTVYRHRAKHKLRVEYSVIGSRNTSRDYTNDAYIDFTAYLEESTYFNRDLGETDRYIGGMRLKRISSMDVSDIEQAIQVEEGL